MPTDEPFLKFHDCGPAFPISQNDAVPNQSAYGLAGHPGMTLRDYFAAKALPAIMYAADESYLCDRRPEGPTIDEYTRDAYRVADAMLKAREL